MGYCGLIRHYGHNEVTRSYERAEYHQGIQGNMTVKSLSELIGRRVSVAFESIRVTCEITDVKVSYGKTRLQVKPISGSRDQWIEPARVTAFVTGDIEQWTIPCDLTMTTLQGVK